jgi:diguanylate cyclase (GGDEF)-like protein/PAS domain S-box-containing protein
LSNYDICKIIVNKHNLEYIIVNREFKIEEFSDSIDIFCNAILLYGDDIRESFYELIGYEKQLHKLLSGEISHFELKSIKKAGLYLDFFAQRVNGEHIMFLFEDITRSKLYEQALMQNRNMHELLTKEISQKSILLNRYQKAMEEGMPIVHLSQDLLFSNINKSFSDLSDYRIDEVSGRSFFSILYSSREHTVDKNELSSTLEKGFIYNTHTYIYAKENRKLYVNLTFVPVLDDSTRLQEVILFVQDLTLQQQTREKYERLAIRDPLTGLYNRYGYEINIKNLIKKTKENAGELALMFLDLDGFKSVNDTYGHHIGDALLQAVSQRLKNILREHDILARIGGDEFVVLIQTSKESISVENIAKKILKSIGSIYFIENHDITIGVSIGIARYPKQAQNEQELTRQADAAMYQVKKSGKNGYALFNDTLTKKE